MRLKSVAELLLLGITAALLLTLPAAAHAQAERIGVLVAIDAGTGDNPTKTLNLEHSTCTKDADGKRQATCVATFEYDDSTVFSVNGLPATAEAMVLGTRLRVRYVREGAEERAYEVSILPRAVVGPLRFDLAFGVQFSQENGSFSEQNLALAAFVDTMWEHKGGAGFHTFLDLTFAAIPNQEEVEGEGDEDDLQTFLKSRKAFTPILGFYYNWEVSRFGDDVLAIGPVAQVGFQTITEDLQAEMGDADAAIPADMDTVKRFYSFGGRFAHYRNEGMDSNPEVLRSVRISMGQYENFGDAWRVSVRALVRFPGSTPLYAGVLANLGSGEGIADKDDVRMFGYFQISLDKLTSIFGGAG